MTPQTRENAAGAHRVRSLLVVIAALLPVLGLLVAAPAASAADTTPKITFCHATNSDTNPYNVLTADGDSIIRVGHDSHVGPVWNPALKDAHTSWGDVIPPFDWTDKDGTHHFAGLNADRLDVIENGCVVPPVQVELAAPVAAAASCDDPGTITIEARTGVTWTLDGATTTPGTHPVPAGEHVVTATALTGYVIVGQSTWTLDVEPATGCTTRVVAPVPPIVVQSPRCDVQGSYTIPATEGVRYFLGAVEKPAATYPGPASGTITATAEPGYTLADPTWSFALDIPAAEGCPTVVVVVPVAPEVTQSTACDAQGSYTIPATVGVRYYLDDVEKPAGRYDGPASGTITAEAEPGYTLSDPTWSVTLSVPAAEVCASLPSTGGTLPKTGGPVGPMAGVAALLLALGTGLVVAAYRRPTTG